MTRVCLSGLGKTGKEIARAFLNDDRINLVSAVCSPNSEKAGKDLGEVIGCGAAGVIIEGSDRFKQMIFKTKPDVVVDFSNPSAALANAAVSASMRVNTVMGTTGFSSIGMKRLFVLTRKYHTGIVYAPNITLGVNVLMLLANLASSILNTYDFQITEIHHKHKKDSPSGTAKKIAGEIRKGLASSGVESSNIDIPIHAVRAGGVVGIHEVMIVGEDDQIKMSHESFSRRAFAQGAIRTVEFIKGRSGYYEMNEVLSLREILGNYVNKEYGRYRSRKRNDPETDEHIIMMQKAWL